MEQSVDNQFNKINKDLFKKQIKLENNLYDVNVPIELKSEKALNGKQYLLAIPITTFFSKMRHLYILIHILNGNSIISLRLIEYFVVNYVLDNNTYFNIKKYNSNLDYVIQNLFKKNKINQNITQNTTQNKNTLTQEIREDIKHKQILQNTSIPTNTSTPANTLTNEDNNFDNLFMIHNSYKNIIKKTLTHFVDGHEFDFIIPHKITFILPSHNLTFLNG